MRLSENLYYCLNYIALRLLQMCFILKVLANMDQKSRHYALSCEAIFVIIYIKCSYKNLETTGLLKKWVLKKYVLQNRKGKKTMILDP